MSSMPTPSTTRCVGYFEASDIGAKQFSVSDIRGDLLSHVIYAFAEVTPTGACVSVNAKDDAVNFPQLLALAAEYPPLQVLISIGGASHSTNFPNVAADPELRAAFVQSSVQFMIRNGFDGIDIDWEFPGPGDSANFTALLQALRAALDAQGADDGRAYLLTIAASAGQKNIANLPLADVHPLLDWINLETYDFATAHSTITNFNAPLFTHAGVKNVDAAVRSYLAAGVPAAKISMGLRFVATAWQGVGSTNKGLLQPDTDPAPGTWDAPGAPPSGSIGFQDIEDNYLPSYTRTWDKEAQVPWLYSADTGIMVSYEDPQSLTAKVDYSIAHGLGGVMIWELGSDDRTATLLSAVAAALGG